MLRSWSQSSEPALAAKAPPPTSTSAIEANQVVNLIGGPYIETREQVAEDRLELDARDVADARRVLQAVAVYGDNADEAIRQAYACTIRNGDFAAAKKAKFSPEV